MFMATETTVKEVGSGGRNVLSELDKRVPTSFYWSLTILATIGGFLFGYDTANIGSALPFVPYSLNGFAQGYLVAGASAGAAVGALAAGRLADKFGRKSLLLVDALIYAIGALLSRGHAERGRAAVCQDADRAGDRRRLGHRDRVHRRVRTPRSARRPEHAAAVDDHRRHPGGIRRRPHHLVGAAG